MTPPRAVIPTLVYRIPSETTDGQTYNVAYAQGEAVCDCRGYRSHRHCKHQKEVLRMVAETKPEETTALVPIKILPQQAIVPTGDEFDGMKRLSKHLVTARGITVPKQLDTASKVLSVVYAGWELGVKPMTALRHISLINGKVEPDGQLKMGIVMANEPDAKFEILENTHEIARIRFSRPSRGTVQEFQYTIEDAKRSGQAAKPGPWKEYTSRMLMWSAVNIACRLGAPDLINSITAGLAAGAASFGADEDATDDDDDDEAIEGEVVDVTDAYNEGDEPEAPPEPPQQPPTVRLQRWLRAMKARKEPGLSSIIKGINLRYTGAINANGDLMLSGTTALSEDQAQDILYKAGIEDAPAADSDDTPADADAPDDGEQAELMP